MRRNVYTVGQVNSYIKNMFTQDFMLNRIYIKGEVSNCKYHGSGHLYFTLKDETGTISCVMFAGQRRGLAFRMEEGQKVIVLGTVDVYERDGRYQLYAREILLDGAGDLYQRFQKLKEELEEMGMFAEEYKRPIPRFAGKIGIVTAQTGAAIQDIRNIASRRNPYVQLILCPARVQGEGSAESIAQGIKRLDAYGVDVIIVGRGGGSIEDLWAFNEEMVARAIFHCETPVISAVGHETDYTIADFTADLRAPTPSAAAELAVYEVQQVYGQLESIEYTLRRTMQQRTQDWRRQLEQLQLKLKLASPHHQLQQNQQYLAELEDRLRTCMEQQLLSKKHQLELYIQKVEGLSPLAKLKQGYVFATDEQGRALQHCSQVSQGELLDIHLQDGTIKAEVIESVKEERKV
ncbi:MAG: exodeoxyribonuclease VII large subunit [Lachnospiraceae bacterium]|nr:exodeoxyribonuclease VII large subunit [Lachnospiraceae bacterium]